MPRLITPETRAAIAAATGSLRTVARDHGVSPETVRRIRSAGALSVRAEQPFGMGPRPGPNTPRNAWTLDQPPPPPAEVEFRPGYHDRTYRAFSTPIAYDGWSVERIRAAVSQHDQGFFIESYALCVVAMRFGPVLTALAQAVAPIIALPRYVLGGTRGLSRVLAAEVEARIAPRAGLMPSPYFQPTLWGSIALDVRMMGFAVLQHVFGEPDAVTGVRPLYTRRWPTWAVNYYPYRRTFVALTDSGPVDIISGDGKFTLVADDDEPHHLGAIRALGLEVLAGTLGDQALASYVDRYGNPKLWGTMPPNVAVDSPQGRASFEAMATILGPNGFGLFPNGATLNWAQLSASQSSMFKDLNEKVTARCAGILLGSDGTITSGTGGVYQSPTFWGVRRDIIDRTLKAAVRAVNYGDVRAYLDVNYAASIAETRGWVDPVLSIPLPDPDADARQKSYAERATMRSSIITAERAAGLDVTQERVDELSESLGLPTIMLDGQRADETETIDESVEVYEEPADAEAIIEP